MVLKELIFNSCYIWEGVVVLKELIFNSFLGRELVFLRFVLLDGLERTDF